MVQEPELGSVLVKLSSAAWHDVDAVRFDVVETESACDASPILSKLVALESEVLPASVSGEPGASHAFADALLVLPAGGYRVCATPLHNGEASTECASAAALSSVVGSATQEIVLVSQCTGPTRGANDVVLELNTAPSIEALSLNPSKFISSCESLTLAVTGDDPDGDELSFSWALESGPDGATLHSDGAQATFFGPAGDYQAQVTVTDSHQAQSSLSFPLHVSAETCAVPDQVQAIFTTQCAPCHISGSSGGLSLATSVVSYANLVGTGSSAVACVDRTRVVPGAAEASYLVHKLRGAADICGVQMPRNRPPLAEPDIATIAAWIDALPH
jgi:hypothetical protein